ncbi:MAG TPA: GtrA family protein [Gammaproteobacteria bacterium]|nr:GtrA family protein [Gammaproteobacteria bacterium]
MKKLYQFVFSDRKTILSFLMVGGVTTWINFTLFALCFSFLHLYYQLAVSIAFIGSVIFHFNANRYFTFKSQAMRFQEQIIRYIVLLLIGYILALCVTYTVVEVGQLSPYIGYIMAIAVTITINYLLLRFWVFVRG